jgi:hypothetical protein
MTISELEGLLVLRDLGRLLAEDGGGHAGARAMVGSSFARASLSLPRINGARAYPKKSADSGMRGSLISEEALGLLDQPCEKIIHLLAPTGFAIFSPDSELQEALHLMADENQEYALVRENQDSIAGIFSVSRAKRHLRVIRGGTRTTSQGVERIYSYMSRKFGVESSSATLGELIERLVIGRIHSVILVNAKGVPQAVVGPRDILDLIPKVKAPLEVIRGYAKGDSFLT